MSEFDKDTWQTPKYFFRWLENRFAWFHFDGCANKSNTLCDRWIGKDSEFAEDFLAENISEQLSEHWQIKSFRIFANPPYSDVTPFVKQAKRLRDAGHTVVMLLNNDKSTQWYQNHIHNVANEVIDITGGRIAFIHPVTGEEVKGNSKGQMVVVFDPTIEDFVQRSVSLDFVKKVGGYGN
ncbi:phage N-6-adenine-methyltransferase [[Pasteurella] mairii]|uniref:Phage N-6-adenine-methyltransferase n=1 Tax=[Pasteurella] mairii TaxID=757 RepID=A0A379B408_9PAST|nr:phage N-6-adenine-methyltransferase [[Pasteurella] mairii]